MGPDSGFRRTASGWRWPARRRVGLAALAGAVALAGALIWLIALPRVGTDLSAALTRAGWAGRYPGAGYVFAWYGGLYPAGYSLLAPYLLAAFGTRALMAAATVLSASLMGWLLARHRVPRARAAVVWAAVALCTELTAGRASFTVALPAAFGCVLAAGTRPRASPGWERQLDTARNPLFYSGTLTPAAYHAWLAFNAVRYVAISEAVPDSAARAEARLIRAGQPWLVPVWHDSYWPLYQVAGTLAMASPRPASPSTPPPRSSSGCPGRVPP